MWIIAEIQLGKETPNVTNFDENLGSSIFHNLADKQSDREQNNHIISAAKLGRGN